MMFPIWFWLSPAKVNENVLEEVRPKKKINFKPFGT